MGGVKVLQTIENFICLEGVLLVHVRVRHHDHKPAYRLDDLAGILDKQRTVPQCCNSINEEEQDYKLVCRHCAVGGMCKTLRCTAIPAWPCCHIQYKYMGHSPLHTKVQSVGLSFNTNFVCIKHILHTLQACLLVKL